jgi:hypothetical protein
MKSSVKILLTGLAAFAAGAALVFYFVKAAPKSAGETSNEGPAAAPVQLKQGASGEAIISLDTDTQARLGLKMETPATAQWQPGVKAYGRVLDPAPLGDLVADLFREELIFDKSHQELERAKVLKQDNNISERAFQDTETTYTLNFAAVAAIRQKIQTQWGGRIAEMTGPIVVPPGTKRTSDPKLGKILGANGSLIRIDIPAGERVPNIESSRIFPLAKRERQITATYFSKLPAIDPQTQQQGLLFLNDAPDTADSLAPGEAVEALIKEPAMPINGVLVPSDAVLRYEGKGWIYVQTGTNDFTRTEIPLDRPLNGGWFASEHLPATNRIVITGAQTVLSAELSSGNFNSGSRD